MLRLVHSLCADKLFRRVKRACRHLLHTTQVSGYRYWISIFLVSVDTPPYFANPGVFPPFLNLAIFSQVEAELK